MNNFVSDLIAQIFRLKKIKECLNLRLFWIRDGFAKKSEYEKNEIEIVSHETFLKLLELDKKIIQKQTDLQELLSL
jgi:hypothetical protein